MKNFTFFNIDEDLLSIVKQNLIGETIIEYKQILTGWTNIVYAVKTDKDNYIFRFPRNDLFSKRIIVDCEASQFLIKNLTEYNFANLQLKYDNKNRPFSQHKMINGIDLATKFNDLNDKERDNIVKTIAKFYSNLHSLKPTYQPKQIILGSFLDFINELANVDDNFYDFSKHNALEWLEKNEDKTYVYGDLNSKNILLNDKNEITAFIDYSFFSFSSPYVDLSRIAPYVDEEFLQQLLFYYQNFTNKKIDKKLFDECVEMIKYIEEQYKVYMENNFIV